MPKFSAPLYLENMDGNLWRVEYEFSYIRDDGETITVPKDFITDLASVPWPASMLIPKSGRFNQAAVLHDWLYTCQIFTRKKSDLIFKEAMQYLGVNWFIGGTMYNAVSWFGWTVWKRKKPV